MEPIDLHIMAISGDEPVFDDVMTDFLRNMRDEFVARCAQGGLLEYASLGLREPWLWRLTFHTRGLARGIDGAIRPVERHVVAVRFLPDYLRHLNKFQMLALMEPRDVFHPNLKPPAICLNLYPGMTLLEIAESLHRLFAWQVRQLAEIDAFNPDACVWGRSHLDELPTDTRRLFGRAVNFQLEEIA